MTETRELNRLRYLAAIGITPLVSRRVLPGAKATCKLRLKAAPPAVPAPREAGGQPRRASGGAEETATTAGARLSAELRQGARVDEAPARPPTTSPPRPQEAAVTATERFRIALLFVGNRLWLEDLGDAVLAREQVDLVAAIAAALTHPKIDDARPAIRQFDWPLHGNTQLDLGAEEAASALSGFIGRQVAELGPLEIICLGEAVALRLRGLGLAASLRELPSTREMLAEPRVKRRAWELLRR